jgi:lipid-A-disaccharide synthase
MVITYRMSSVNRWEYFFVRKSLPEHIGMPNILAQREICPEFIQEEATPQALANEIIDLLLEPERLLKMRSALKEATQLLGQPGGAERTAQMVVELARQGKR